MSHFRGRHCREGKCALSRHLWGSSQKIEQEEELTRRGDQSVFPRENSRDAPRAVGGNRNLAPVTHCSVATLYSWSQRTGQRKVTQKALGRGALKKRNTSSQMQSIGHSHQGHLRCTGVTEYWNHIAPGGDAKWLLAGGAAS